MTRRRIFFAILVCWGGLIVFSSIWLVSCKHDKLQEFSRKVAENKIVYYPPRAPILDRDGRKVCYTEWIFYVRANHRGRLKVENFLAELQIANGLEYSEMTRSVSCEIPPEKLSAAVRLARKYRLQISKKIVRRMVVLPEYVRCRLGMVLLYSGVSGLEEEYDRRLKGTPGVYILKRSPRPLNAVDRNSIRIISGMREGKSIRLKQSIAELQCGIMPEIAEEYEKGL